jgi:hypothetical protein
MSGFSERPAKIGVPIVVDGGVEPPLELDDRLAASRHRPFACIRHEEVSHRLNRVVVV